MIKKLQKPKNHKLTIRGKNIATKDKIQGLLKQIKGVAKCKYGHLTGNQLIVMNGDIEKVEGYVQEKFGINLEEVRKKLQKYLKKRSKDFKHMPKNYLSFGLALIHPKSFFFLKFINNLYRRKP